ncbi:MAG: phage tail sheath family protein [Actinobacteria bacterium]|nr:phage tail sheath family protein [Actinomycetota bacterium]
MTIFVGETEFGPVGPTRINGRTDFERLFGGYQRVDGANNPVVTLLLPYAVDGYFRNGGASAYILRAMEDFDTATPAARPLAGGAVADAIVASSPGVWANGRLSATIADSSDDDPARFRLAIFYNSPSEGQSRLVEDFDRLTANSTDENYLIDVLQRSRFIRWAPDATIATPQAAERDNTDVNPTEAALLASAVALGGGTGGAGSLANADFPDLLDLLAGIDDASLMVVASDRQIAGMADNDFATFENIFVDYCNNRPFQDLFFIGDLPAMTTEATPATRAVDFMRGSNGATAVTATTFNGVFWPHVRVADPVGAGTNPTRLIPPGGHIAGLFNRIGARRGIWKAAAGTEATLGGVTALGFDVLDVHQDSLNPRGINALRRVPQAGLVVWGTRTAQPATEWRYIPVRLTAMFLRRSIYNGIQWAVFEPNDEPLWQSLRNTIGAFMETQFRNGAFAGRTSSEAYSVKVDAETTTPLDQAAGIVNILVGFAPLRPAEFVVVRLSQRTAEAA